MAEEVARELGPVTHPLDILNMPTPPSGATIYRVRVFVLSSGEFNSFRCELAGKMFTAQWTSTQMGMPPPQFTLII